MNEENQSQRREKKKRDWNAEIWCLLELKNENVMVLCERLILEWKSFEVKMTPKVFVAEKTWQYLWPPKYIYFFILEKS